ncbi:MAG: hypothetical protein HY565_05410 [Candidatus Kerfeldbacteria bacterium]|nr:hypothetical protein [Candidatus Kerfeldbacteria bacterium]
MKKYIISSAVLALILTGCTAWQSIEPADNSNDDNALTCGGIAGILCPTGYVCDMPASADYPDATGQCIPEYVDRGTVGTTCPVDGPFEASVDSDYKYCVCPDEYEKESSVIGYENCYDGAECPILEVECVKTVDAVIEVGPSEDDLTSLVEQGELYNEDYGYIIEVGADEAASMTEVAITPFDGVTATYLYCYDTTDVGYASFDCPGTATEAFRINVYTTAQYDEIAEFSYGTVITEAVGYVYELTHPNGLFPDDVPADDAWYDAIIGSFHFAG